MAAEQFKKLPLNPDWYEVSSLGKIFSLERVNAKGVQMDRMELSQRVADGGHYFSECRPDNEPNRRVSVYIHRAVAEAFVPCTIGNMEDCVVRHIDGDKSNNTPENLYWVSVSEVKKESSNMYKAWETRRQNADRNQ